MKGKVNLKTIITFAILILVIVLLVLGLNVARTFMSGATADYEPQNLTETPSADGSSATISWTTDKAVEGAIYYGTNMASLLLVAKDVEAVTEHNVLLTNLRPNKTYYYKIVAGENIYDNANMMFSFKTGGKEEVAVPSIVPTVIPTITSAVTLPEASSSSESGSGTSDLCNKTTDYNQDGVINSLDYLNCLKGKISPTKAVTN